METYCASCKKNNVNKNSSVRKTNKQNRIMLLPTNPVTCGQKIDFHWK